MTKTMVLGGLLLLASASCAWGQTASYHLEGAHTGRGPYRGRLTLDEREGRVRVEREVTFADGSTLVLEGVGARRGDEVRATFSLGAGLSDLGRQAQQGLQAPRLGQLRVVLDVARGACRSELRLDDGARATDVGSIAEASPSPDDDAPAPDAGAGEARPLCRLDAAEVRESSGVACSRVADDRWWTHGDSGSGPRLFAFDRAGATRAFDVAGADAVDWEDVASFEEGGRGWLVVGDTGNNKAKRKVVALYLVEEPRALDAQASLAVARRLDVRYEDGRHDCEGVAVDPVSRQLLLVTKVRKGNARPALYAVPLEALTGPALEEPVVARRLADLPAPTPQLTTALDVSPDGLRLVVLSYGDAYGWTRTPDEPWAAALARAPVRLALPAREQGEGLCFGRDGRTLYLTSEGAPCPVWEVAPLTPR